MKKDILAKEIIQAGMDQIRRIGWLNFDPFQLVLSGDLTPPLPFSTREEFLKQVFYTWDHHAMHETAALDPHLSAQEKLFEVFMTRFEQMNPYKAVLQQILHEGWQTPGSLLSCAPEWLISLDVLWDHAVKQSGLEQQKLCSKVFIFFYLKAQYAWLHDQTEDLSETMAALDQQLHRFLEIREKSPLAGSSQA